MIDKGLLKNGNAPRVHDRVETSQGFPQTWMGGKHHDMVRSLGRRWQCWILRKVRLNRQADGKRGIRLVSLFSGLPQHLVHFRTSLTKCIPLHWGNLVRSVPITHSLKVQAVCSPHLLRTEHRLVTRQEHTYL